MKIENAEILKYYFRIFENVCIQSNDELCQYLIDNYNIYLGGNHNNSKVHTELLINCFIFVYSQVVNDLKEVTERIKYIEEKTSKLNSGSYEFRRLVYFKKINIKAKVEIEEFLIYGVHKYVKKCVTNKDRLNFFQDDLRYIVEDLPYNYYYNKIYYDPLYDFSIESKFRYLDDCVGLYCIDNIIDLKKASLERYYEEIDNIVKLEKLPERVFLKIESHYRLKNRREIFLTLYKLFKNRKYQSFINLAVNQIEGLFYDLCVIINDEQETDYMGTLSEKAEKVFRSNYALWISIYPYYAFQVPIYRNIIAHNGLWNNDNLKDLANELIFDLNTILEVMKLPYIPPNNLLLFFINLRKEITHLEYKELDYEYIVLELFSTVQRDKSSSKDVFTLLKERRKRQKVYENYTIPITEDFNTNLYEECDRLIGILSNNKFWNIILKYIKNIDANDYEEQFYFIDSMRIITNNCLNLFKHKTPIKEKCVEVKKELMRFEL